MEYGYVVIGIIALLFLGMYGFSYASVIKENNRIKEENLKRKKEQEIRRQARVKKQEELLERVRLFNTQREKARAELTVLKKIKNEQKVG
jgi:large-conductance mechanosensitive channel